jgi:hypothetical protein
LAYEKVKEVDALDINEEGQELWENAMRRYFLFLFLLNNISKIKMLKDLFTKLI